MKLVRVCLLLFAFVLTMPVLAQCMMCADGCCCPNCNPFCARTEYKCLDSLDGYYYNCTNVGETCPYSGCIGWSGCTLLAAAEASAIDIVAVTVGEPRLQNEEAAPRGEVANGTRNASKKHRATRRSVPSVSREGSR